MIYQLVEEFLQTAPATKSQRDRVFRAMAEADTYRFEDVSAIYQAPGCRVTTLSGNTYLCFPEFCCCPDWKNRCFGNYDDHGQEHCCKHQIACFITGSFVYAEETAAQEEVADPTLPEVPDSNEWANEWDGYPENGEYPQELAEARNSAADLSDREILR